MGAATDFVSVNHIFDSDERTSNSIKICFHLNSIPLSIPETLDFLTSGKTDDKLR